MKHQLWMTLGRTSAGLRAIWLYCKLFNKRNVVVDPSTELVIEGYPRSANTYSVAVMWVSNGEDIKIAHHVHGSAQINKAVKLGIPAILLIRNPADTVASLLMRCPYLSGRDLLKNYIMFHRSLMGNINNIIIVDFETTVSSMDKVIEYINRKHNRSYFIPDLSAIGDKITSKLEYMDMRDRKNNTVNKMTIASPTLEKKQKSRNIKNGLECNESTLLRECNDLYKVFLDKKLIC